jgi:uncharacterized alpha-E superfamily protein
MSHGEGWHFIQLGKFLERATGTTNLVDAHFREFAGRRTLDPDAGPDSADYLEWIGLLRCATAFESYCKVYTATIETGKVAEFLVLNADFPHSLRFAVGKVQAAMNSISEASPSRRGSQVQRVAGRLSATLSYAQLDEILGSSLHPWLDDIRRQCGQIHGGVYEGFISYPIEAALEA